MTAGRLTLQTLFGTAEQPIAVAAARQLSAAVEGALGRDWPVTLVLSDPAGEPIAGSIWLASLIDDVTRDEPLEETRARWSERIGRWSQGGASRILLATLFRSVSPTARNGVSVERLRRLNMMALALSRAEDIEIVDIDRLFAWCGARVLGTDYRCLGDAAAALGGHAFTAAIFAAGLDGVLPPDVEEEAARRHGGLHDIAAIVRRRVAAR